MLFVNNLQSKNNIKIDILTVSLKYKFIRSTALVDVIEQLSYLYILSLLMRFMDCTIYSNKSLLLYFKISKIRICA